MILGFSSLLGGVDVEDGLPSNWQGSTAEARTADWTELFLEGFLRSLRYLPPTRKEGKKQKLNFGHGERKERGKHLTWFDFEEELL